MMFDTIIKQALREDIGSGDITTVATVSKNDKSEAEFLLKVSGVIAGLEVVRRVFSIYDESIIFTPLCKDGEKVNANTIIAKAEGSSASLLTTERTALNFLQRMSGIATMANNFSEEIKHTKAKIIDTRKTVPGLRMLDKLAVKLGGCENHRIGLFDMFLIKDNHIAASHGITNAINACIKYRDEQKTSFKIEVEVTNLVQLEEALKSDVDIIMLDNFEVEMMKKAVKIVNGKCKLEASGGINLNNVKSIAESGVDFISVGALTHSVKALDISLNFKPNN